MCLKTFKSAAEKDHHTFGHFPQEKCFDCNQILIRIGEKVFTLHNDVTCMKKTSEFEKKVLSTLSNGLNANSGNEIDNYLTSTVMPTEIVSIEEVQIKSEIIEQIEEEIESMRAIDVNIISDSQNNQITSDVIEENTLKSKRSHRNNATKTQEKFKCDECGKMLGRKDSLQRHKIVMHGASGGYFCNICIKIFPTSLELDDHKGMCSWRRNNRDLVIYGKFECDICGAKLKNKAVLRGHMRWKHEPNAKQFKCKLCESTFVRKSLLDLHYNRKHLNILEYVCSDCGRQFKTNDQLKSHSYIHTDEKPIKCLYGNCEKGFRSRANREQHMRTHNGEKPFHCSVIGCGQKFKHRSVRKRHISTVHGTRLNRFSCRICNEMFSENSGLKTHKIRVHSVQG